MLQDLRYLRKNNRRRSRTDFSLTVEILEVRCWRETLWKVDVVRVVRGTGRWVYLSVGTFVWLGVFAAVLERITLTKY
ncbi:MAG: hypothetical protein CLLPBCKN_006925 [Chroococcidiopsis cubana SAG 39.79]|uniref:hypothetical protein n=1 Tax=Chroococcidiopsis cubana TaxID=171392 RepID=UPI000F8F4013|nr:hypothetical protein [Chroococcidiopsis cubana]MDZ4877490.1 hypothetical protein [Chroococcidiopsis cubana SAG 39.79]